MEKSSLQKLLDIVEALQNKFQKQEMELIN